MPKNDVLTGGPLKATGGVMHAPLGSTMPTDAKAALDGAFVKGGYVGEDGLTRSINAQDEKIKAWGGDTIRVVRSEHSVVYKLMFLESANADTLKLLFGKDNVTVSGQDITVNIKSDQVPRRAFVFDMKDGEFKIREAVQDGQLSMSGDVQYVHSNIIKYEVEIEAFPDENGVKAIQYISKPA
ncbi:phage tail tube protein [Dermabacteraceae bacterium P13138]